MRKLIFSINMSLDGFFEGPQHELDWTIADEELHVFYADLLNSGDVILFGRVTYLMMRDYWPTAPMDPASSAEERRFADALNPMKKVVFSTTLKDPGWNTQVISSVDPDEIRRMKDQPGRPILLSGASLVQQFAKYDLIDEYQLMVMPVAIGAGKPVFSSMDHPLKLKYEWSKPLSSGAVALCYKPNDK